MTETLSLISVVVMALLLWREHRAHKRTADKLAERNTRGPGGRFVKRGRGSSI